MRKTPFYTRPFQRARELRKQPTLSEQLVWEMVRAHRFLGLGFRRQHPVAGFFPDFYCPALRLAVELDGRRHCSPDVWKADMRRDRILREHGIETVHFSDSWIEDALPELRATLVKVVRWRAMELYGEELEGGGKGCKCPFPGRTHTEGHKNPLPSAPADTLPAWRGGYRRKMSGACDGRNGRV
jgi:very-short-patch-repair endonuclease